MLGIRRQELDSSPSFEVDHLTGLGTEPRLVLVAELDGPEIGGQVCGEVHLDGATGAIDARHGGGEGPRRVDDDQVSFVEKAGQLREV